MAGESFFGTTEDDRLKAHLHDKRFGHGTPENEHPCQNSYFAIYLFTRQFFAGTFL